MASCANVVGSAFTDGTQPDVKNQRTTGGSAFYRVYDTSDGRQLVLAGQEMKFIRNLLTALGKPEMIDFCEWPGAAPEAGDGVPRRDLQGQAAGALDGVAGQARHLLRPGQHAARGDRGSEPAEAAAPSLSPRMVASTLRRPCVSRTSRRSPFIASRCWASIRTKFSAVVEDPDHDRHTDFRCRASRRRAVRIPRQGRPARRHGGDAARPRHRAVQAAGAARRHGDRRHGRAADRADRHRDREQPHHLDEEGDRQSLHARPTACRRAITRSTAAASG